MRRVGVLSIVLCAVNFHRAGSGESRHRQGWQSQNPSAPKPQKIWYLRPRGEYISETWSFCISCQSTVGHLDCRTYMRCDYQEAVDVHKPLVNLILRVLWNEVCTASLEGFWLHSTAASEIVIFMRCWAVTRPNAITNAVGNWQEHTITQAHIEDLVHVSLYLSDFLTLHLRSFNLPLVPQCRI